MRSLRKLFSNVYLSVFSVFLSGLISVYDNVMNVIFFEDLEITEKNPFASWIISNRGVEGLVEIKSVTTILAVAIMLGLIRTKYRIIVWPVLAFQLSLFYYLTFHIPDVDAREFFSKDFGIPIRLFFEFYLGEHKI